MHITAIVFDFGGVATYATVPWRAFDLAERAGISAQLLRDGYARYRHLMDGGFLTPEQMYRLIFADAGFDMANDVIDAYVAADRDSFIDSTGRSDAVCAWAQKLRSAGYRIGILSNMSAAFAPVYRASYASFFGTADAVVISGDVAAFKPQPCIYRHMEECLGIYADAICLIDDSESNCAAARAVGWHAVQFSTLIQAEADLQRVITGVNAKEQA